MKKATTFLLSILLLLFLFGCGSNEIPDDNPSQVQSITTPHNTTETETITESAQACRIIPTFRTLEEYDSYLDRFIELSPDFIHYDTLKEYGEFLAFRDGTYADWDQYTIYQDGRIEGNCSTYTYELLDPAGYTIIIYISPVSEYAELLALPKALSATQNVHTATKENGYYKFKNLYYGFHDGQMVQILLPYKQTIISIKRPSYQPFSQYPVENNTLIAKLLSTETAESAVAELNANIALAQLETQTEAVD